MPTLTDRYVAKLVPPERGNVIHWDSGHKKAVTGFGVRITAAGAKAFVFNYRTRARRSRRLTIGSPPVFTVTAAREVARTHSLEIRQGRDPLDDRAGERDAPTVADLAQLYLDTHVKTKRPAPALTDRYTIEREILPAMKHLKVADVKFRDVAKLHRKITDRAPYRANRVLALLSTIFGLAIQEGWRADNPTKGVKRNQETPRERFLSGDELIRLLDALATYSNQKAANAIRLLLLTGARRGEVLALRWDQIDEKGVWTKPASNTKTKRTHRVPLPAPALEILSEMREHSTSPFVFPGRDGGHLIDLKRPWPEICQAAGIEGLRLHDLRHSYASLAVAGGASLPIIGKLLGHTQTSTTSRYAHLELDPLRAVAERVGAIIEGAGKPGSEVAKLRRSPS